VPLETLIFLKCWFPSKFMKTSEFAAYHFIITTQMRSVVSDDPFFPVHCLYCFTAASFLLRLQVLGIFTQFMR
jgi:hypothetical protein